MLIKELTMEWLCFGSGLATELRERNRIKGKLVTDVQLKIVKMHAHLNIKICTKNIEIVPAPSPTLSAFLLLQNLEDLLHLEDPSFKPYQGHNAFREKYFSGVNKKCGKQEEDKTRGGAETLIWFQTEDKSLQFFKDKETDYCAWNPPDCSGWIRNSKESDDLWLYTRFKS